MFIRVIRPKEEKEILLNVANIWKIEVSYGVPSEGTAILYGTSLRDGAENPEAIRLYKVFVGSETISLVGNPNDPVIKVLEDIYKDALKA